MAKEPAKTEDAAPADAAPKSKKKMVIIIVAAVVLALVLGGGAAFFIIKKNHVASNDEEAKTEQPKKKNEAPPVIVKLDPFTVKLQPDEGKPEQYMQTVVEMEVLDAHVADKIKSYTSKIRSKTVLLLMGKKPSDLSTPEGVEKLANDIRNMLNEILDGATKPPETTQATAEDSVQAVYLTQFIIQ